MENDGPSKEKLVQELCRMYTRHTHQVTRHAEGRDGRLAVTNNQEDLLRWKQTPKLALFLFSEFRPKVLLILYSLCA